jgi:molybdate transport system substrate-binding protein
MFRLRFYYPMSLEFQGPRILGTLCLLAGLSFPLPLLWGAQEAQPVEEVRVAAASDLRPVLPELAECLQKSHPGFVLVPVYGASGILCAQILEGASFDLFLSADANYPELLVSKGIGGKKDMFLYAFGRLALWVAPGTQVPEGPPEQALLDPRIRRVALANPAHAPYGRAAEAALRQAGLLEKVKAKLVYAQTVAGAMSMALSGAAQAALVSASLLEETKGKGWYRLWPREGHPPIAQVGIVLSRKPAALALRDLMLSEKGRGILARHGFELPSPSETSLPKEALWNGKPYK